MSDNANKQVVQLGYASVVDSLMYSTITRSDIAFVLYKLFRCRSNLNTKYWKGIIRFLVYLERTIKF